MSAGRDRLAFSGLVALSLAAAAVLLAPRLAAPRATPAPPEEPKDPPATSAPTATSAEPPRSPPPPYVREDPEAGGACAEGMLLVSGVYCPFVGHTCARFLDEVKGICAQYGPDVLCEGRLVHRRFCVDRYEYPNLDGVRPAILVTFDEAAHACAVEGKRLCSAEEWEFACEGTAMWPYPYGRYRDASACNLDKPFDEPALSGLVARPERLAQELAALEARAPSGGFERCVSPFGVRDTTGNVAEWVVNEPGTAHAAPFRSGIKGGSWAPSRAACRPLVATHPPSHRAVDLGFRCCQDARGSPSVAPAPSARVPKKRRMP